MGLDWREVTLSDVGSIVTGKTPSTKRESFFSGSIPFVTPTDMNGRRTIVTTGRYLTDEGASSIAGARIPEGAVLVSCIGSDMGKVALAGKPSVTNQQINSIIVAPPNSNLFVYYNLSTRKNEIRATAGGSAQPILNKSAFGQLKLLLPPPDEQRAIAGVLGALDDKIEQNRRTAQVLERLARAIFRAWFVYFEPFKVKVADATTFPSMPQCVFDTLPTHLMNSEIGAVPEGWEVKPIGDVVAVRGGATPSTKNPEYWDNGVHCWATPKDMSRLSHPVLLDTERRITDAGVGCIGSGLLPSGTVLMSSRAPVGYLAIAGVPTAINQGFIAMVCHGPLPPTYVLNWAQASMEAIHARASGTTFPEISKKIFRPLPVIVPSERVISAFREIADPLFDLLVACVKENLQLETLRDYLLPRLLSGSVRVEAANG